jgi:hypothetical protein
MIGKYNNNDPPNLLNLCLEDLITVGQDLVEIILKHDQRVGVPLE